MPRVNQARRPRAGGGGAGGGWWGLGEVGPAGNPGAPPGRGGARLLRVEWSYVQCADAPRPLEGQWAVLSYRMLYNALSSEDP